MKKKNMSLMLLLFGFITFFYPDLSCLVNRYRYSSASARYLKEAEAMDQEDVDERFREARAFNRKIGEKGKSRYFLTREEEEEYLNALACSENGLMGVIEIEKLNLILPVYHGVDAATLRSGVGHVPGSSLPVGDAGEHVLLSGHTGMAGSELFTRLDEMRIGDRFSLTVIGRRMEYRVTETKKVLPDQTEDLFRSDGRDLVTLITCTPYGVNSHRLLVTGERVESEEAAIQGTKEQSEFPLLIALLPHLLAVLMPIKTYFLKRKN